MVLALENVSSPAHVQPDVDGLKSAVLLKTFDKSILFMHVGAYGVKPVMKKANFILQTAGLTIRSP